MPDMVGISSTDSVPCWRGRWLGISSLSWSKLQAAAAAGPQSPLYPKLEHQLGLPPMRLALQQGRKAIIPQHPSLWLPQPDIVPAGKLACRAVQLLSPLPFHLTRQITWSAGLHFWAGERQTEILGVRVWNWPGSLLSLQAEQLRKLRAGKGCHRRVAWCHNHARLGAANPSDRWVSSEVLMGSYPWDGSTSQVWFGMASVSSKLI